MCSAIKPPHAMTAILPHYKPKNPLGAIQPIIVVGLILSTAFLKIHSDQLAKAQIVSEYRAGRSFIFSKIKSAVENHDVETLLRLHGKYANSVADSNFNSVIRDAVATATARETELEQVVSKHLDLTRHREEIESRQNVSNSRKQPKADDNLQRLSLLPQ